MAHLVEIINGKAPSGGSGGVSDADLSNVAVNFFAAGVVLAGDYQVTEQASPNMTVKVNTGTAYVYKADGTNAYVTKLTATANVTIPSNSSGNPRIDAIVIKVDLGASPNKDADNVATLIDVQGTPAPSPVAPTDGAIQTAVGSGNPFYRLANVTVANGAVSITNANIADTRIQTPLKIITVLDVNGNELLKFVVTTTAVNYVGIKNNITNNAVEVQALGDDTNIDLKLVPKGSGDVDIPTGANIQVNNADPKRGIYVPAPAMFPAVTNGAAVGQIETTTNKVNIKTFDFDASTEEYVCFGLPSPAYWDGGTVTVQFFWTAASGSGDVIWGVHGLASSNDDALDTAYGTAQEVTDTLITANDCHVTSVTSALTIAGSPVAGDFVNFRIYRKAAAGGDTLGVDARLLGVIIRFNRAKYDDQ
jgi:hypothetical protein